MADPGLSPARVVRAHPRGETSWGPGEAERELREEGLDPRSWANGPGYRYTSHSHPYHKVLYCMSGSITFHIPGEDVVLGPGDRLELPPGVEHSATVGDDGVRCVEGARA